MSEMSKPTPPPVNAGAIPAELKAVPHWVVWGYELRYGRWAKPPISCRTGKRTDVTIVLTTNAQAATVCLFDDAKSLFDHCLFAQ